MTAAGGFGAEDPCKDREQYRKCAEPQAGIRKNISVHRVESLLFNVTDLLGYHCHAVYRSFVIEFSVRVNER